MMRVGGRPERRRDHLCPSDDLQVLSGTSPAHLVELFREMERDGG